MNMIRLNLLHLCQGLVPDSCDSVFRICSNKVAGTFKEVALENELLSGREQLSLTLNPQPSDAGARCLLDRI